ncbi:hypothetical protein [Sphingomonas sp.]|uniref:hypothetical protein n=1 Tax=Sphingomonas sp. TaxID=28214 RepID=UPI000DB69D95|nr:hypothetical protein [Sphingomonas sp.]PZU10917.1 MAG: hypothetical protein DI605_04685 [Sphingomonas sp.]
MSLLEIIEPYALAGATATRGTGADNLRTPDPKEVWADSAAGSVATLTFDLGAARPVDTIFLGYVTPPAASATWAIRGGLASADETAILATSALRVPDVAGDFPEMSHALWAGASQTIRYLAIDVAQPSGFAPLMVGVPVIGAAFVADLGQEWGAGRKPIDTGTATSLLSGGFAIVEGARKSSFSWTFGDLTEEEADALERIALRLGTTKPGLVIERPDRTAGLRSRIHYGLFQQWRQYERRNRRQTRWDISIEQWV